MSPAGPVFVIQFRPYIVVVVTSTRRLNRYYLIREKKSNLTLRPLFTENLISWCQYHDKE